MKRGNKIKKKTGQISVFIIIAIIIVAIIALYFLFNKNFIITSEKVSPEIQPIYNLIDEYIKSTAENDIFYIGQTGGYFTIPNKSTEYGISYYYDKGENLMPTKEKIEKEIADYMNYMLSFCTQNFADYPDFKINSSKPITNAKIKEGKVVFNVKYPVTITKGDKNYFFSNFENIEIPVRLDKVYELSYNITQDTIKNKNNICISCMHADATSLDLFIEYNNYYDNETLIFTIRDPKSQILGRDFRFNFANKYDI